MSETTLQFVQFFKLIVLAVYALLYGLGGVSGKWKRRFIAPFILVLGITLLSLWSGTFSWLFLLYYPLLTASLHLGYGADEFWVKVKKRMVCGLALGFSAIPIAYATGSWGLFSLHMAWCVTVSVFFGVFNITSSARAEETFLAASTAILPLAMF